MTRKIASIIFLLTGMVIGLGAFGHDSNARRLAEEFAKVPLDAGTVLIVNAVWHFCSGCMFVLGAICVWSWWRVRTGAREALVPAMLVGVFYVVSGIAMVSYAGKPFFWLFVVLGGLLLATSLLLLRSADPAGPASTH